MGACLFVFPPPVGCSSGNPRLSFDWSQHRVPEPVDHALESIGYFHANVSVEEVLQDHRELGTDPEVLPMMLYKSFPQLLARKWSIGYVLHLRIMLILPNGHARSSANHDLPISKWSYLAWFGFPLTLTQACRFGRQYKTHMLHNHESIHTAAIR